MKKVVQYIKDRKDSIDKLLENHRRVWTPSAFHQLRVEIKKLNAVSELLNYCLKDFKRNKTFKPLKVIFAQAGKVRELQVEEAMLKKYVINNSLNAFKENLKEQRLAERNIFFSILNKAFISKLSSTYKELIIHSKQVDKKKVQKYLKFKRKNIVNLLNENTFQSTQIHELRTQLKKFNYNEKMLENKKNAISTNDLLPDLLGKWHDCQVVVGHMDKAMDNIEINRKEQKELQKIKEKFFVESNILYDQITIEIPKYIQTML